MTKLPDRNKITRILIVQTAFLGDVVLITPLIRETRKLFPDALLDVLVIPQTGNVLENNPHLNNIITFDKRSGKFKQIVEVSAKLRQNRYQLALTPHSSITTMLLLLLARIPIRIGFDRYAAGYFLTHKVPHLKNRLKIEKNLHLLSFWKIDTMSIDTELFPSESDYQTVNTLLPSDLKHPVIAMAPGSVWYTKRWPEEYYKTLIKNLARKGASILFVGGPEEEKLCREINRSIDNAGIVLAGKTTILQSAAALSRADALISNDSGALHLGNAMKIPVYAFFGPTVKELGYYPFRDTDYVFEVPMDCRPCGSHGHRQCPLEHHECMKNITPETVFNKIRGDLGL